MTIGPGFTQPPTMVSGVGAGVKGGAEERIGRSDESLCVSVSQYVTAEIGAEVETDSATRNDALGRLFQRAFKWPTPPMPENLKSQS